MKNLLIVVGIIAVVLGLFYWSKAIDPAKADMSRWASAEVDCTSMEGQAEHFHPHLTIYVDGLQEAIPANIGITTRCFAELHTHDTTGTIHVESPTPGKAFVLGQFFAVWERPIERDGFTLSATLAGKPLSNPGNLTLSDRQDIVLNYLTTTGTPKTSATPEATEINVQLP